MSHTRYKTVDFGRSARGLATVGFALAGDMAWTPATEILTPLGGHTGIFGGLVTFPTGYTGPLLWTTDTTEAAPTYACEDINPGSDEWLDGPLSGVPAATWANPSRTLTAFGFTVTVSGYSSGQDPASLVWEAATSSFTTVGSFGAAVATWGPGGPILVDQDYGGSSALQVVDTATGQPLAGASVQAYKTVDFDAGNRSVATVVRQVATDAGGNWSMFLPSGNYTLIVFDDNFNYKTASITV